VARNPSTKTEAAASRLDVTIVAILAESKISAQAAIAGSALVGLLVCL
jgi:hypothetical protein